MAQDFRNVLQDDLPTSHNDTNSLLWTGGNYDAIIGIRCVNISSSAVTVDVYIRKSSTDYYIAKGSSIPPGGSLELIQGGAKIVLNTTDVVYGLCGTSNGCHVWISYVDAISE